MIARCGRFETEADFTNNDVGNSMASLRGACPHASPLPRLAVDLGQVGWRWVAIVSRA